jgi:MFS superfamily sulfate permease-like transporter
MAYAEAAGLPPTTGLYATIVPLTAYALFGRSRVLVLGPDSSLAGIIAAVVLPLAAGDPARAVALAGMLSILAGLVCIAIQISTATWPPRQSDGSGIMRRPGTLERILVSGAGR